MRSRSGLRQHLHLPELPADRGRFGRQWVEHELHRRAAIPADGATAIVGVPDTDADFSAEGPGGGGGEDTVRYEVDTIGSTGPFTVEARLLYQSVRPTFAAWLHSTDARVTRHKAMYAALPPTVEVLAAASVRLGD